MEQAHSANYALVVAAGLGSRAGSSLPKQYLPVNGKPMLRHSIESLAGHDGIGRIFVVIGAGHEEMAQEAVDGLPPVELVTGGATRRESVEKGLAAISAEGGCDNVLIHDAARPFLTHDVIARLLSKLEDNAGAVPVLPVVDSLARGNAVMGETVDRRDLWRIQTPQAFHFQAILEAHRQWDTALEATDDARMAQAAGFDIAFVEGDERLAKFTLPGDFAGNAEKTGPMTRVGNGFDVHRLAQGEELWLCGLKIEHTHGLEGHSDADVAIHALVDAILGAAALGDIGDHFPPSEKKWKGVSSDQFLRHAISLAQKAGYRLSNADITIICETPKIGPHKQAMRERLAEIANVQLSAISVKATTTERLGFAGREEGIAVQATATLRTKGD